MCMKARNKRKSDLPAGELTWRFPTSTCCTYLEEDEEGVGLEAVVSARVVVDGWDVVLVASPRSMPGWPNRMWPFRPPWWENVRGQCGHWRRRSRL